MNWLRKIRHIGCFFTGDGDMQDVFCAIFMLNGLHIVADGIHIPEHRADKVDTLLVDGDNIGSVGIGSSRFDCEHGDNIRPVGPALDGSPCCLRDSQPVSG